MYIIKNIEIIYEYKLFWNIWSAIDVDDVATIVMG